MEPEVEGWGHSRGTPHAAIMRHLAAKWHEQKAGVEDSANRGLGSSQRADDGVDAQNLVALFEKQAVLT